jgi:hypothetical protein
MKTLGNKVIHVQYIRNTDRQLIIEEDTFPWLSRGDLKEETESELIATQNQSLHTKYATKMLQTETESRLCQQVDEAIEHIISACPILANKQYIKRHDRVCAQQHFNICKEIGVKLGYERWYDHMSELAETSCECKVTILWD